MAITKTKFSVDNDFWDEISEKLNGIILEQLRGAKGEIQFKTGQLIQSFLKKNPVYKGILGDYAGDQEGMDLQAEFGLTDSMAQDALNILLDLLRQSVVVTIEKTPRARTVGITLIVDVKENYKNKINGEPFEYQNISKNGTETTIYWMKFLLDAANSFIEDYILGVEDYGIIFQQSPNSRSGRATMTLDETKVDERFPYVLNKRLITFGGDNFIEEVLSSKEFKLLVSDAVERAIDGIGD